MIKEIVVELALKGMYIAVLVYSNLSADWQSKGSGFESRQLHQVSKLNSKKKAPEKRGFYHFANNCSFK